MYMKGIPYITSIFILGLIVGGGGVYMLMQPYGADVSLSRLKVITGELKNETVSYTNDQYGFSFRYPIGLIFEEFDEAEGAQTIVFQKPNDSKIGFQIYITPYVGDTITGERILYDASGKVSDLKEENLREDFLTATFFSDAPILGKTREIWFLNRGYLFEVTTYAEHDSWIRDIVETIEFK